MDDAPYIAGLLKRNGVEAEVKPFVQAEGEWKVWLPEQGQHLVLPHEAWDVLRAREEGS
jgi:hypothetical protein